MLCAMVLDAKRVVRGTYSFAKTPLKAAHVPLVMARATHCDL